jgi:hypothetical protein
MDYSKIDAPLGAALAETSVNDQAHLIVFIHINKDLDRDETAELQELGIDDASAKKRFITATVSPTIVDKLSHKPWVRSIKLSQELRPLGDD